MSMERRPIRAEDFETLYGLHREAYRAHIERTWGAWDDGWQRTNFAEESAQSTCEALIDHEALVGYVQFVEEPHQVRLWNIVIRPDRRGQGIGSGVLLDLQQRAATRRVPLTLRVFLSNDFAYRFYIRLGFRERSRSNEAIELVWEAEQRSMSNEWDKISTAFQEPGDLIDGDLRLSLHERFPGDPIKQWVPTYRFAITVGTESVGKIELRLGATDFMVQFGGQVGYEIESDHRGHRFAARALRLLPQLARRHGFNCLWATCDPANWASRRTCELAGADLIEIVDLPQDCEMHQEGERQRCRYRLAC
jgi:predicted acetyltransferase/ribosomal protein S18 acetylase RimI-like enzyme